MAKPGEVEGLGPKTPLSEAGRALLASRLADVRRYEGKLSAPLNREAVHDMRVAARRLRSAIHLFGRRNLRRYEPQVKALQDALGQVRDLQLQTAWLQSKAREKRPGLYPLLRERRENLRKSERELKRRLSEWRMKTAPALARALGRFEAKGRLGGSRMRRPLKKRLSKVTKKIAQFEESPDAETVHRLRIAVKKLRYDAELVACAFPAFASVALSVLAPLQKELGAVHDNDVLLELLAKLSARAGKRGRRDVDALLSALVEERRTQASRLSQKMGWLASERIPDRLRTLLD